MKTKLAVLLMTAVLLLTSCNTSPQAILSENDFSRSGVSGDHAPASSPDPGTSRSDITPPAFPQKPGAKYSAPVSPEPEEIFYDFTKPAPESAAVENAYFEDAAFIGDSRTDGMLIYGGLGTGDNLTHNGLTIFDLESNPCFSRNGVKYTALELLEQNTYCKLYLCLGINELGYFNDIEFYDAYLDAIQSIRAVQPSAIIYIQGLIPLNEGVIQATGGKDYLTNDHLVIYNDLMRQAAQEAQVVYLDLYSSFVNEDQELPEEASRDGVHLTGNYCKLWAEYLRTHTVDPSALGLDQEEAS